MLPLKKKKKKLENFNLFPLVWYAQTQRQHKQSHSCIILAFICHYQFPPTVIIVTLVSLSLPKEKK